MIAMLRFFRGFATRANLGLTLFVCLLIVSLRVLNFGWCSWHEFRLWMGASPFVEQPIFKNNEATVIVIPPVLSSCLRGHLSAVELEVSDIQFKNGDSTAVLSNDEVAALQFDGGGDTAELYVKTLLRQIPHNAPGDSPTGSSTTGPSVLLVKGEGQIYNVTYDTQAPDVRPFRITGKVKQQWSLSGCTTERHGWSIPSATTDCSIDFEFSFIPKPHVRRHASELYREAYEALREFVLEPKPAPAYDFDDSRSARPNFKFVSRILAADLRGDGQVTKENLYEIFYLLTLLHATQDSLHVKGTNTFSVSGYPKERLRTELAKAVFAPERISAIRNVLDQLEMRLADESLNQATHYTATYAYADLSLILNEIMELATLYVIQITDTTAKQENKDELARVLVHIGALNDIQLRVIKKLLNEQRRDGGWRYLWKRSDGEQPYSSTDSSVSILVEFALSEALRQHYLEQLSDLLPFLRMPTSLANPTVEVNGETKDVQTALQVSINLARGHIWRAAFPDKQKVTKDEQEMLASVMYTLGGGRSSTLLGGFYSTYAGAYIRLGTDELQESDRVRIATAREALKTGIPFESFKASVSNQPDNYRVFYNQMFFGRAVSRVWQLQENQVHETEKLHRVTRELIQVNIDMDKRAFGADPSKSLIGSMRAYFLSLCLPALEVMNAPQEK